MRRRVAWAVYGILMASCSACSQPRRPQSVSFDLLLMGGWPPNMTSISHYRVLLPDEPLPHGTWITWTDYEPMAPGQQSDLGSARYTLDGATMGQGRAGFGKVLAEVAKLPRGSTLIFYPRYDPEWCPPIVAHYPFHELFADLDAIVVGSDLSIVLSDRPNGP